MAADKDQIQNAQERQYQQLRGKGKSTKHSKYLQCDAQARTGTKRYGAKID